MKIVFASLPISGHINPLLGMATFLADAGHEIVFYTGSAMRERVIAAGLSFHPVPAAIDVDFSDVDKAFPERAACAPGPDRARFDFERIFIGSMEQQYRGLEKLLTEFPAEVVFAENFFYGTVPLKLNRRAGSPRVIHCGITVSMLPRTDHAPWGPALPFADDPETSKHYRDVVGPMIALAQAPTQAVFDRELGRLGAGPAPCSFMDASWFVADAFLQSGVPGLEYPRGPLPTEFQYIGLPLQAQASVPLPVWASDLDDYANIVLVTQGTVANGDLEQLVLPTIRSLSDAPDTLVIATGGGRDTADLQAGLPANARLADYLPFDWLMPRVNVLVTNGGFGTVLQALAAGTPMVLAGTTEDKSEVSARVAFSGTGIDLKTDTPAPDDISAAVHLILNDPGYGRRAQAMAAEFSRYDGKAIVSAEVESGARSGTETDQRLSG